MTQEQAAQMIAQNDKLLAFWDQFLPLLQVAMHDVTPALFVGFALWLGFAFGWSAT